MTKKAVILGALLLTAGAAWAYQRSNASSTRAPDLTAYDTSTLDSLDQWITHNILESDTLQMTPPPLPQVAANQAAMLATISQSEGTAGHGDPYRVCYGYRHTISSLADHPAITGEWRGEPLSDGLCSAAGLGPGCVSTAAGKYQIIKPTWIALKLKLGLLDFSAASQDAAAIELLRQRGAIAPLARGDFAAAVNAARKEWASLPGAGYGQGERSIAWLTDQFTAAGGVLA